MGEDISEKEIKFGPHRGTTKDGPPSEGQVGSRVGPWRAGILRLHIGKDCHISKKIVQISRKSRKNLEYLFFFLFYDFFFVFLFSFIFFCFLLHRKGQPHVKKNWTGLRKSRQNLIFFIIFSFYVFSFCFLFLFFLFSSFFLSSSFFTFFLETKIIFFGIRHHTRAISTRAFGARGCRGFRWTPKGKVWLLDCTTSWFPAFGKTQIITIFNFIIVSSYNFIILSLLFQFLTTFDT